MRKILGALVVAVMMAASLVAFSGSPAQAACPYTGCIRTSTHATAPAKVHKGDRPGSRSGSPLAATPIPRVA